MKTLLLTVKQIFQAFYLIFAFVDDNKKSRQLLAENILYNQTELKIRNPRISKFSGPTINVRMRTPGNARNQ